MAPARGQLVVSAAVLEATAQRLADAGRRTPAHEGLVWWLGRLIGPSTFVCAMTCPPVDSGPQHVIAAEAAVGAAASVARRHRLGVIAQVHSHPGSDTRHSDGDDELVLMPFEGMFSLVVARYGTGDLLPSAGAGLHQFQDRRWVGVADADTAIVVVPTELVP